LPDLGALSNYHNSRSTTSTSTEKQQLVEQSSLLYWEEFFWNIATAAATSAALKIYHHQEEQEESIATSSTVAAHPITSLPDDGRIQNQKNHQKHYPKSKSTSSLLSNSLSLHDLKCKPKNKFRVMETGGLDDENSLQGVLPINKHNTHTMQVNNKKEKVLLVLQLQPATQPNRKKPRIEKGTTMTTTATAASTISLLECWDPILLLPLPHSGCTVATVAAAVPGDIFLAQERFLEHGMRAMEL
jgi:hypothetical protein